MTEPKLATSRPAALTGRVGQGGDNRVHDVALVQALLGLKRAKGGRPYLAGKVTGSYDKETAVALLRFRMDQRDGSIKRPLATSGPMLNKLAQGQSLAVLVGTATPYSYATMAEAGPIKGAEAGKLSAERKVELMQVMRELTRDWGIAFDVEIKAVTGSARSLASALFESRPLVAHFTPRKFAVHGGQRLSPVMSNTMFRDRVKELHDPLAADIKARCTEAFGIKDPVDVKIQERLKDDLACVVRTDLEGVEALAQFILADWRKKGFTLAVQFFENYLKANANFVPVSRDDALSFPEVQAAVAVNVERFWEINVIAPETDEQGLREVNAISKYPKENVQKYEDSWVSGIRSRAPGNFARMAFGLDVDPESGSIGFGPGGSNLASRGEILLQRTDDWIAVTISVTHVWSDDGYNFDKETPFYDESQILERHGKAKQFKWAAEWTDVLTGDVQIQNPFTPIASRRGTSFEARPLADNVFP
ncbi:MAG: hypothetical protein IID48_08010 [Proteobacteria bacterium]|nr:hypothetical protein [Pseudomonadota bacterium]